MNFMGTLTHGVLGSILGLWFAGAIWLLLCRREAWYTPWIVAPTVLLAVWLLTGLWR